MRQLLIFLILISLQRFFLVSRKPDTEFVFDVEIRKYPDATDSEEFSKTITAGTGTIRLELSAAQTSRLQAGRNFFDVVLTINGKKIKVIKGTAIVEESASV